MATGYEVIEVGTGIYDTPIKWHKSVKAALRTAQAHSRTVANYVKVVDKMSWCSVAYFRNGEPAMPPNPI